MHQEIVFGESGQAFELEASVLPREPVSVVVTNVAGEVQAAIAGCAIDRVSTVLSEDAPRGARVLHVGSTQGITPNTRYDVGGQRFTVYRIDGAHRLILRRPLLEPAKEDAALRGCRIIAPVDDAWVRDQSKLTERLEVAAGYQLTWTHTTGSEHTTADVVRTALHARVTPDDVELRFPGWRAAVGDPILAIAEAAEIVRRDMLRHPSIRRARDATALRELVIVRAQLVVVEEAVMFRGATYATLEAGEHAYQARVQALVVQPEAKAPNVPRAGEAPVRFSVGHVRVIDELMKWFAERRTVSWKELSAFAITFMPQLITPDERAVAAKFLAAQTNLSAGASSLRDRLVEELSAQRA